MTRTVWSSDGMSSSKAVPSVTLKWAFRAHKRFLDGLAPEVRRQLGGRREDAYAIVYGRTQVGKSTLILNLMGLPPDSAQHVSTVLRGGQKEGNSSTAVPMEYRQSHDHYWHIFWDGRKYECSTDSKATEEFRLLREEMEGGRISAESCICVVEIPSCYFVGAVTTERRIRILDLPGIEAANPIERKFVERVAGNLVPNADLILLVGRADDLSFLSANHLAVPGITDWQYTPNRFRIVTTYSFTPDSIREFAREACVSCDALPFRERLINQLQKFGSIEENARKPDLYFPLEIGDSWKEDDLKDTHLDTMINSLMADLRHDIVESMTSVGRLMNAVDAHILVTRQHQIHIHELQVIIEKLTYAKNNRERGVGLCEKIIKKTKDKLERVFESINSFENFTAAHKQRIPAISLSLWDKEQRAEIKRDFEGAGEKNTDIFLQRLDKQTHALKSCLSSIFDDEVDFYDFEENTISHLFLESLLKIMRKINSINVNEVANAAFSDIRLKIDGYWTKEYFFTDAGSNYAKDLNAFLAAHKLMTDSTAALLNDEIDKCLEKILSQMQKEKYRLEKKVKRLEYLLEHERSVLVRINANISYQIEKSNQMEMEHQKELRQSRKFSSLLIEEYNNELEATWNTVMSVSDPILAFEALVLGASLPDARRSVWARIDSAIV